MSEFFEYKYLAMENYYKYICEDGYTHLQAAGRSLVDYTIILSESNVKSLAIYSTVLVQVTKYTDNIEGFKQEYYKLINLYKALPLENLLSENEKAYLDDDVDFIRCKFDLSTNKVERC